MPNQEQTNSECKHDWWSLPNERWKSNPEKISVFCAKCDLTFMAKVIEHWKDIDKVKSDARVRN